LPFSLTVFDSTMRLIVFDIDGTLTETMKVDAECYVRALDAVFGIKGVDTDWTKYRHSTDSGIFEEIFTARMGMAPAAKEIARFQKYFIELLHAASACEPFSAIDGAPGMLSSLGAHDGHGVALATGAWSDSARLKMASAGMCFDDHPSASGDDAHDRESIIRLAITRAEARFGKAASSALYVGDGIWDGRACRALGLPFIGIGSGRAAEKLRAEGAVCVFPNLTDQEQFLETLDRVWGSR
jgi:phosphoglycolate phosphatase-like HAD superfamily hydrolase